MTDYAAEQEMELEEARLCIPSRWCEVYGKLLAFESNMRCDCFDKATGGLKSACPAGKGFDARFGPPYCVQTSEGLFKALLVPSMLPSTTSHQLYLRPPPDDKILSTSPSIGVLGLSALLCKLIGSCTACAGVEA